MDIKKSVKVIGIVDCNNFYCSCERLFNPESVGKPTVVLSNNDGAIIARSQEAKDLGIKNRNNSLIRWRKAKENEMRSQTNIDIDKEIETKLDLKKEIDIH